MINDLYKLKCEVKKLSKSMLIDEYINLYLAHDMLKHTQKHLNVQYEQLKQQLEEKNKLLECYQKEEKIVAKILGDKDLTIIGIRVHLKNLIVELKNKIRDRDLIIEEKDKKIANLKNFIGCKGCVDVIKKSNENQKQLVIQELEKVKMMTEWKFRSIVDVVNFIDNQIKELKGE